jgi:hypothetical protein
MSNGSGVRLRLIDGEPGGEAPQLFTVNSARLGSCQKPPEHGGHSEIDHLLEFIAGSKRGLTR